MAETLRTIRSAITNGDHDSAWSLIEPLLSYPSSVKLTGDELGALLSFFERVCPTVADTSLAEVVLATRDKLDDQQSLTKLGAAMLAHGLHAVAATPLSMANRWAIADDNPSEELTTMLDAALARTTGPSINYVRPAP